MAAGGEAGWPALQQGSRCPCTHSSPGSRAPLLGPFHGGFFLFCILQLVPITSHEKPNKKIKAEEIIAVRISSAVCTIILPRVFPDHYPMPTPVCPCSYQPGLVLMASPQLATPPLIRQSPGLGFLRLTASSLLVPKWEMQTEKTTHFHVLFPYSPRWSLVVILPVSLTFKALWS